MTTGDPCSYRLLDSGGGRRLESLGSYRIVRQAANAFYRAKLSDSEWANVHATHERSERGGGRWHLHRTIPDGLILDVGSLQLITRLTPFGHVGFFAEQADQWVWQESMARDALARGSIPKVLNLFAYTGGSTLALARGGAEVTHVDAAHGIVSWARENAAANALADSPIRWIVDDCRGFLRREARRGVRYDGCVLDPPSFGRGRDGEVFKLEDDLPELLRSLAMILNPNPMIHFSCHTPGFTPSVLGYLLEDAGISGPGQVESGDLVIAGQGSARDLPSGVFLRQGPKGSSVR